MQSILYKIYTKSADDAVSDILATYQQEDFAVVNFIYFANIVSQSLFSESKNKRRRRENIKKSC
jgi:hypothetical protein